MSVNMQLSSTFSGISGFSWVPIFQQAEALIRSLDFAVFNTFVLLSSILKLFVCGMNERIRSRAKLIFSSSSSNNDLKNALLSCRCYISVNLQTFICSDGSDIFFFIDFHAEELLFNSFFFRFQKKRQRIFQRQYFKNDYKKISQGFAAVQSKIEVSETTRLVQNSYDVPSDGCLVQ